MVASRSFAPPARGRVRPAAARFKPSPTTGETAVADAELVRRFVAGEEAAFVAIVARHREKIFSVAFSVLHNHADAEEIAQDTFIRAHRGLVNFRGDSSLATWLHRIALNLARNRYWYYFRRSRHATSSFDTALSDDNQATLASLIASDAPSPVQEAAASEFSALVAVCMEQLGPGHREILTQRNIRNCSYDDIARTLGVNIGTVKSRIARARVSLRGLLAKACPDFGAESSPGEWFSPSRPAGLVAVLGL